MDKVTATASGLSARVGQLELRLSQGQAPVYSFDFTISYDWQSFDVSGFRDSLRPSGWTVLLNVTGAGSLSVSGFTTTEVPVSAGGLLLQLEFRLTDGLQTQVALQVLGLLSDEYANEVAVSATPITLSIPAGVPPVVANFSPADGSTGVDVAGNVVLTFSEAIARGTGNIEIRSGSASGAIVESFNVASSSRLSIVGTQLTIDPTSNLSNSTQYFVVLPSGSITDLAGNSYAGTNTYDFTTKALQTVSGTVSNDTLVVSPGNASINAGGGVDTVVLPMFPNVFSLQQAGVSVVSGEYGRGYNLQLTGVEYVQFGSTQFKTKLAPSDLTSGAAQQLLGYLTDLYLAFFGRAPDVEGLEYWQRQLLDLDLKASLQNKDFTRIAVDFGWSQEAQALFPVGGSNREFVRLVYQNCFGRDPDQGGWDFWTGILDTRGANNPGERGAFVKDVILGAYAPTSGPEDRGMLMNKHDVALHYVNELQLKPQEGFDAAINDLLALVTLDEATQRKAEYVIDYIFANPVTLTGIMGDRALLDSVWPLG